MGQQSELGTRTCRGSTRKLGTRTNSDRGDCSTERTGSQDQISEGKRGRRTKRKSTRLQETGNPGARSFPTKEIWPARVGTRAGRAWCLLACGGQKEGFGQEEPPARNGYE
jgi:hypothetical protein